MSDKINKEREILTESLTVHAEIEQKKSPFFSGELYERMMSILMAIVAILITIMAVLQTDMGNQSARAKAQGQQFAMKAIGAETTGQMQAGYAWGDAYRHWREWDSLAFQTNDDTAKQRFLTVRDRARQLSPLLQDPYFDPATDNAPDIKTFETDAYIVDNTEFVERYLYAVTLGNELGDKEDAYSAQQLLLAVALFLYGLSMTMVGRLKWFFVGVGTMMTVISLIWMLTVYIRPITYIPDEAITVYAEGVGLAHQGNLTEAVAAFNKAIEYAPAYANIYYSRANAQNALGNYEQSASDYEQAMELGRADVNVPWNLGWTYYLLGRQDKAIKATETALEINNDQIALIFNLALMQLAKGNVEEAQTIYTHGIEHVTQQVIEAKANEQEPSSLLWWYLNTATTDMDSFLVCLSTQVCENAPPYETIATSDEVQTTGRTLRRQLKNVAVSLEYLGELPTEQVNATINELEFAMPVYDDKDKIVDFTPLESPDAQLRFGMVNEERGEQVDSNLARVGSDEAKEIFLRFSFSNMKDGQLLTVKTYNEDNSEVFKLRLSETWEWGNEGEASVPITPGHRTTLIPGEYRVELYVEGQLSQEGGFIVK
jgi:tetratricopeptide (TPR) repeat protein